MQKFLMITYLVLFLLWATAGAETKLSQMTVTDSIQHTDSTDNDTPKDSLSHSHEENSVSDAVQSNADSTQRSPLLRTLITSLEKQNELNRYQAYLAGVDSIYPSGTWSPYHLFISDANGLSESLRFHPRFISFPLSLSTSLNRALPDGVVAPIYSSVGKDILSGYHANGSTSMDILSPPEVQSLYWTPAGQLNARFLPTPLLKPETIMFWETGVFDENVLLVRFARPLSHRLHMGVFSTFRSFERVDYDHQNGGIYPFYESIYQSLGLDTSLVANAGTNPLTDEQIATARLRWDSLDDWWLMGEYRYSDLHNDLVVGLTDTTGEPALQWAIRSLYEHQTSLSAHNFPIGPVKLNTSLRYKSTVQRSNPRFSAPTGRGTARTGLLTLTPYLNLTTDDTLTIKGAVDVTSLERFNGQDYNYHTETAAIDYTHSFQTNRLRGTIDAEAGSAFLSYEDTLIFRPFWSAAAQLHMSRHSFSLYGGEHTVEPSIPIDTLTDGFLQAPLDSYIHAGAEATVRLGDFSLLGGYRYIEGLNQLSLAQYWPNGLIPYPQPTSTLISGIQTGRWRGLSLASTWYFSDSRPYVKSHSVFSFYSKLREKYQQLFVDLAIDYWSERDPALSLDDSDWNRTLLDVYLKVAVQVKTFRLFWKIDNIINREIAYIPGYMMPGLTFRWGFNWLLRGW